MKRKIAIELAKEAGLVFNTEVFEGKRECFDWHAERLQKYADLVIKWYNENVEENPVDQP